MSSMHVPVRGTRRTKSLSTLLMLATAVMGLVVTMTLTWGLYAGLAGPEQPPQLMAVTPEAVSPANQRATPSNAAKPSTRQGEAELRSGFAALPAMPGRASTQPAVEPAPATPGEATAAAPVGDGELELEPAESTDTIRQFNGRPIRPVRTITMKVTAYSPDARSCGKWADGITASGYSVWTNGGRLVAADTDVLPFGSIVTVPGYDDGKPVPVLDRGGKIKGPRLDVLYATHEQAMRWGVQDLEITVWAYAD